MSLTGEEHYVKRNASSAHSGNRRDFAHIAAKNRAALHAEYNEAMHCATVTGKYRTVVML